MRIEIYWGSAGGLKLSRIDADASGSFQGVSTEVPFHDVGTYNLYASSYTGLASGKFTISSASIAAAVVKPVSAFPGQKVSVEGSGFNVGSGFYIRWKEPNGEPIGTGAADSFGKLPSTTAVIPQAPAGDYQIYITDDRTKTAVVPFTIVSPTQN